MKKIAFSTMLVLFLILSTGILAEAFTARFPAAVKWNTSAQSQVSTDIYLVNLQGSSVSVHLDLYNGNGTLSSSCGVMPPTISIPAYGTQHIDPSGCYAITTGVALNFDGSGVITTSSNNISIYWRIYDVTVSPRELIDHGKETPTGISLSASQLLLLN